MKALFKRLYAALPFKQPLFKVLRVLPIPRGVFQHLHFTGIIEVPVPGSGSFRMRHHGYVIENELFWLGLKGWEKVSMELWVALCRRSETIIDAGANTGVYALVARTAHPGATIVAVEAVERVHRKLMENIALNGGGISALNAALTDHEGEVILYDLAEAEHVLSVSLNKGFGAAAGPKREVPVAGVTVAGLVERAGIRRLDLLKIDVEGHEPQVLDGFGELLRRDRPTMLIEVFNEHVAAEVNRRMEGLGYLYFNIDEVTWPPPRTDSITRSKHLNYLLCQPDVAKDIGLD